LSESCEKSCQKVVKKLSKSCQKVVKKLQNCVTVWEGGRVGQKVLSKPSADSFAVGRRQKHAR
jgi:hypothetical protein